LNNKCISKLLVSNKEQFNFGKIHEPLIIEHLSKINPKSAPGCVNIEAIVFKECAIRLAPDLTKLFNLCIENNTIPDDWKTAYITPIYKGKGNKSALDNYRPISIISPISKVFEAILGTKMRAYLENNNLLHEDQNGFREGRSCHLALNTIIDFSKRHLDNKKHVIAIFLDFSKAFDTIDHQLLLIKLEKYGFSHNAMELIKNYLKNRSSIVCFDGKKSSKETLKSGVPQGSILGPLLFILFINDMCFLELNSRKTIFADDSTLYHTGPSLPKIALDLEYDLTLIAEWLKHNRLLLNVKKSNAMLFKWKYQRKIDRLNTNIDALDELEIKCEGEKIPFVTQFKLLGVTLDEYLTFDMHSIALCNQVNWKTSVLRKSSYLFSLKFRITLFKLFIVSKYDYCSTLFVYFTDNRNHERLNNNFSKSIKSYLNIKLNNLNIDEQFNTLKNFKLLPLELRFFQNLVFFIFSLTKSKRNSALSREINSHKKLRPLRTFFNEPIFNTVLYQFSFLTISIKLLNSFIYKNIHIEDKMFRSAFEATILESYKANNKFWT
jgi:hypothetical protein